MNQSVLRPRANVDGEAASPVPNALVDAPVTFALSNSLFTLSETNRAQAEAIRALRTHVMAQHVDQGRRALLVCAVSADSGCSLVAANLAVALSQIGVNTLLIDGNLRNPSLENYIQPSRPMTGLQQRLAERDQAIDHLQREVLPNLSIMYAGGVATNPQELLANDGFKSLMDQCLRDYQMTVVDTPPASNCADARRIGSVLGYCLVVARQHQDRITDISTLIAQLEHDGAKVIGTVLREA